jgi:phospholipase C
MSILDKVKTMVLVMFENRSFDHMLGHISLDDPASLVDGLKHPLSQYENLYQGDVYNPFPIRVDTALAGDLPHEYDYVKTQLAKDQVNGNYGMSGFVEAYAKATSTNPNPDCDPMGYFTADQVPITSFLAKSFCTCNRWFSALPTSTQPNRTMALCGETAIFNTASRLIPIEDNLFDWMDRAKVKWRVYHDGLSFFVLYKKLWKNILFRDFRPYRQLADDMLHEPVNEHPQVIIIEPTYQDSPHIGSNRPNDNHAPLAIGWGEDFLRRTYEAITANEEKFGSTVMIVYYDEHGGFYDHVPPPPVTYTTKQTKHDFQSTGPRIPGIIISPYVKANSVCDAFFDHTSVLQMLAEKFTPGKPYSSPVEARSKQKHGIESLSKALDNPDAWKPPLVPPGKINVHTALGETVAAYPAQPIAQSFENAANQMMAAYPEETRKHYPELTQWKIAVNNRRS